MGKLVLTRKPGEDLVFTTRNGQVLVVRIVSVSESGQVKVACTAPRDVRILRRELIDRERLRLATPDPP